MVNPLRREEMAEIKGKQLLYLSENWRVKTDELQWILQCQHGNRWRDRSFCCTREALIRCIREHAEIDAGLNFPAHHPGRPGKPVAAAPQAPPPMPTTPKVVTPVLPRPTLVWRAPLRGDDYSLDCYEDGYPKLPDCLDRRGPEAEVA
jgi:hypothetical protein